MHRVSQTLASAAGLRPRKKFHFDVRFQLEDLVNCTYLSGLLFVKLRLKDGGNFFMVSGREEVQSHCVKWHQEFKFSCKMYASANTAELEPCVCKVSIRKEVKGGRAYKKLGYVKINLAEYAGAGETQRKYLLESYNEHKHRPDNSILKVKISLRQTSGDVLFKAPKAPVWELSEAEDEGIQADLHSLRTKAPSGAAYPRTSTTSTLSGLSSAGSSSGGLRPGGSLQDVCRRSSITGEAVKCKSVSACSLRGQGEETGSSESSSIDHQHSSESSIAEEQEKERESAGTKSPVFTSDDHKEDASTLTRSSQTPSPLLRGKRGGGAREIWGKLRQRSVSIGSDLPSGTNSLSLPGGSGSIGRMQSHRRQASIPVMSTGGGSLTRAHHRRQQSLTIVGVGVSSAKATPTHSPSVIKAGTAASRSVSSLEGPDTESICSQRSRLSLFPSSRVEHSRVNTESIIDQLFESHDLSKVDEEEGATGGLKIYVDKSRGTVTLAGTDLDRKYRHLKPVDVNNHTSKPRQKRSSSSGASGSSGRSKASLVQPSAATEKPKLMTADQSAVSVTDTPR